MKPPKVALSHIKLSSAGIEKQTGPGKTIKPIKPMKISIKILSKLHKIYTILTLAGVGISVSHVQKHLIRIVQERRRYFEAVDTLSKTTSS